MRRGGHPVPQGREPARDAPTDMVLLGEFGRAHGLRGEIRLKSHTADPLAIAGYGPLAASDGRTFVLTGVRPAAGDQPDLLIARIEGIATREAAEALNRIGIYVAREKLGEAEEDEFFLADLIGLRAEDESGAALGTIVDVPDYGGGELLEIAPPAGPTLLVPFTKAFVPHIDVAAGRAVVVPPVSRDGDAAPEEPERDTGA